MIDPYSDDLKDAECILVLAVAGSKHDIFNC